MAETMELLIEGLAAFKTEQAGNGGEKQQATAKRFKAINRDQFTMRTIDVEKLVEQDHPVRAIWAMVQQLDTSRLEATVKSVEGGKGRSHFDPRLLMAILSDFRVEHKEVQDEIFRQVLGLLSAEGLTELKRVMQDGTKIKAQASGNSFRREDTLREHLKLAQQQIEAMGDPNSEELSQRVLKARRRAIREKQERLQRAQRELEEMQKRGADSDKAPRVSESDPEARIMKQPDGGFAPSYNVQICTDAANKIIVAVEATQAGTDYDELVHGIDAVQGNTGQTPEQMVVDGGYVKNANVEEAAVRGVDLIAPVAENNAEASLKKRGVSPEFYPDKFRYDEETNTFTCPADKALTFQRTSRRAGRTEHQYSAKAADCENCPFRNQCCPKRFPRMIIRKQDSEAVKAFRAKMQTAQAKQIYRTRAEIAETPNAWIKAKFGLRQFRLRGLRKVGIEALWACLTYNIRQWMRLSWKPQLGAAAGGV